MSKNPAPIVDNRNFRLDEEILKILPITAKVRVATGYFYASGFAVLAQALSQLSEKDSLQVILGLDTDATTKFVLERAVKDRREGILQNVQEELNALEDTPEATTYLQSLYQAVQDGRFHFRAYRQGVFHPKAYIFDTTTPGDHAYVGSSNFTRPGLQSNLELNLHASDALHLDALRAWFDSLFSSDDLTEELRDDLLRAVESTRVMQRRKDPSFVTAWEMLLCVAAEFLRQKMARQTNFLAEFQVTGVYAALDKLEKYGGCILADSVGLGKSFVGAQVLATYRAEAKEDGSAYRVLALVPAHLVEQWTSLLTTDGPPDDPEARFFGLTIDGESVAIASQGFFATLTEEQVLEKYGRFDVVLVDEAHRFRNDPAIVKRVRLLEALKNSPTRGEPDAVRFIFLTATPLNNSIRDLKNLVRLCTVRKRLESREGMNLDDFDTFQSYLQREQEPDRRPLDEAERTERDRAKKTIDTVLREIMILRTREFLQRTGGIVIAGRRLEFSRPNVRPEPVQQTNPNFLGLVRSLPDALDRLEAPHITLANPAAGAILAGLYKVHLLKRLESSQYAFRKSLQNYLGALQRLTLLLQNKKKSYSDVIAELAMKSPTERTGEEGLEEFDDELTANVDPASLTSASDEELRTAALGLVESDQQIIQKLISVHFDAPGGLHKDQKNPFGFDDQKLETLVERVANNPTPKTLIFTQYADTAEYLRHHLTKWAPTTLKQLKIGLSTGRRHWHPRLQDRATRQDIVWLFSPQSNERRNPDGSVRLPGNDELDVLVTTDGLSEGANLQDCRFLVNYDLPWNPMRVVQRVGRIDRITRSGQPGQNDILNLISPDAVESELQLLAALQRKGAQVAMFVAKEHGIISSAEETVLRTYGHEVGAAELLLLRDRLTRIQSADSSELERLGRNPLLEGAIKEDDVALWRLSLRQRLDEGHATEDNIKAARAKFPSEPPKFASYHGPDAGVFVYAQVRDFKRDKVREDICLWYDLKQRKVRRVDPGSLPITPLTPGTADKSQEEPYRTAIKALQKFIAEILEKHKQDAAGLSRSLAQRYPPTQSKLITRLMTLRASDAQARKGRGIQSQPVIADEIRSQWTDVFNWLNKNVLAPSDDRELKGAIGSDWAKISAGELHKRLFPFYQRLKPLRQEYRTATIAPEDLTTRIVCGGISIA